MTANSEIAPCKSFGMFQHSGCTVEELIWLDGCYSARWGYKLTTPDGDVSHHGLRVRSLFDMSACANARDLDHLQKGCPDCIAEVTERLTKDRRDNDRFSPRVDRRSLFSKVIPSVFLKRGRDRMVNTLTALNTIAPYTARIEDYEWGFGGGDVDRLAKVWHVVRAMDPNGYYLNAVISSVFACWPNDDEAITWLNDAVRKAPRLAPRPHTVIPHYGSAVSLMASRLKPWFNAGYSVEFVAEYANPFTTNFQWRGGYVEEWVELPEDVTRYAFTHNLTLDEVRSVGVENVRVMAAAGV